MHKQHIFPKTVADLQLLLDITEIYGGLLLIMWGQSPLKTSSA